MWAKGHKKQANQFNKLLIRVVTVEQSKKGGKNNFKFSVDKFLHLNLIPEYRFESSGMLWEDSIDKDFTERREYEVLKHFPEDFNLL